MVAASASSPTTGVESCVYGVRGPALAVHAAAVRPVARRRVHTLKNIPRAEDRSSRAGADHRRRVSWRGSCRIERLIVDPIEDAINELDDIKRHDSRSLDGVGIIQVEFQWDQDPDEKYDEVVREVNRIRADLPADLASLEVRRTGLRSSVNIMQVALVSPDASYRELDDLGRALSDESRRCPACGAAKCSRCPSQSPHRR